MENILIYLLMLILALVGSIVIKKGIIFIQDKYDKVENFKWYSHFIFIFLIMLVVFISKGFNLETFFVWSLIVVLYGLSWYDYKTYWIPDLFNILVLLLGIPLIVNNFGWSQLISFVVLFVIFIIIGLVYPQGLGGGDVKLYLITTLFFGYYSIVVFFLSMILSVMYIAIYGIVKRNFLRKSAFGPYISVSILIVYLWGEEILGFYLKLLGVN